MPSISIYPSKIKGDYDIKTGNDNKNNHNKNNNNNNYNNNNKTKNKSFKPKEKYVKILIEDPYNNRDIILQVTKKQKGVYVWETLDGKNIYICWSFY